MTGKNAQNEKKLYKVVNKGKELTAVKNYLLTVKANALHARWITEKQLYFFNTVFVTPRQMYHLEIWTKKKLDVVLLSEELTIPVEQN